MEKQGHRHISMRRILREREQGQRCAGSCFKDAVYRDTLPMLRQTGTLGMHTGCVNHISFSESGDAHARALLQSGPLPSLLKYKWIPREDWSAKYSSADGAGHTMMSG